MNRRNFEYRFKNLCSYFLLCRNYKKNNDLRRGPAKRDLYLNRAIVKLKEDMDIVHYLNQAQVVEEMHEILFNKSDRMLMQVQKRQVIQSSESSSAESTLNRRARDDFNTTDIRKVFLVKNEE